MKNKYENYEDSLQILNLQSLTERRKTLSLKFAKDAVKNGNMNQYFKINKNNHHMKSRSSEKYHVEFANTSRIKNSGIIYMQNLLNENEAI